MSEIFEIYHASNLINSLTQIISSIDTKQSNADQSNAIAITPNAFELHAGFNLSKTQMREFFAKNDAIEINFKQYIENYFRVYFDRRVCDRNL